MAEGNALQPTEWLYFSDTDINICAHAINISICSQLHGGKAVKELPVLFFFLSDKCRFSNLLEHWLLKNGYYAWEMCNVLCNNFLIFSNNVL